MSDAQRKNFVNLESVLIRAASGRAPGSPTGAYAAAKEKIQGATLVLWDALLRPKERMAGAAREKAFDMNVKSITDALFNPEWQPALAQALKNPNNKRSAEIMRGILNAGKAAAQRERVQDEQ
jgi:hypothetical protein